MASSLEFQAALGCDLGTLRRVGLAANLRLLGDTISISDEDWQRPSALQGWTRAHVITHLARNADALARLALAAVNNGEAAMYPNDRSRFEDIERGSERGALDLQIDLDTASSNLSSAFVRLDEIPGDTPVPLGSDRIVRSDLLPLARLNELVLHHIDLDCGFTARRVEQEMATWLLAWNCLWLVDRPDYPAIELLADSGFHRRLGAIGTPVEVTGPDNVLLAWLTDRLPSDHVGCRDAPILPNRGLASTEAIYC